MQTRSTHPKTVRREEKSDKKKEERVGARLMAEITEPTDGTATATISDHTSKPSSSHLQQTRAFPLTAWREQRHALDDVQIHTTGAGMHTSAAGPALGGQNTTIAAISDPTWPESFYPRSHLPPTCTWAPPPERKCNGQGGGDHACAPAIDLATLLQLTAWIERLDAIMRMNDGEDKVILKIRTRAVGVLDSWVQRWEV